MHTAPGRLAGFVLALAALAAPASAQDDPRFALVASLPTPTVSFQWEAAGRLALRFDGSYSYRDEPPSTTSLGSSFTFSGQPTIREEIRIESTSHSGTVGFAAIVAIHRNEDLRLYVAPRLAVRFSRTHSITTTTVTGLPPGVPPSAFGFEPGVESDDVSSTDPQASLSFGADVKVHRRLAVFGEAGLTYAPDASLVLVGLTTSAIDRRVTTVGTRASVGLMIRF